MNFSIEINMDNSAFEDITELSRILVDIGHRVHSVSVEDLGGLDGDTIRDYNGNTVGHIKVSEGARTG